MHQKILIIGCGGSGKSTLARHLGQKLNLPVIHLDKLLWHDWTQIPQEQFDALLLQELKKDRWIMDGNFNRTIPLRLSYCDTVIFLDFPVHLCILGASQRVIQYYGKTRPDMGENCPERFDPKFYKWIWNFNRKNRERYLDLLKRHPEKTVYILHDRAEVASFLAKLE